MNNRLKNIILITLGVILLISFFVYKKEFAPSKTVLVKIDASNEQGPVKLRSGILGSTLSLPYLPDSFIEPLKIPFWRAGSLNDNVYNRVNGLGAEYNVVLSDLWCQEKHCRDEDKKVQPQNLMWNNLDEWQNFVFEQVKSVKDSGKQIKYWEPINEPLNPTFWGKSNDSDQLFVAYKVAYEAIKNVDSEALVVGPSFAGYDQANLELFLQKVISEKTGVDVLCWHELGGHLDQIPVHVKEMRALVQSKYSDIGVKEYHINEVIGSDSTYSSSAALASLYYLEKADIDKSARACWSNSDCGVFLDGLITSSPKISDNQLKDLSVCVKEDKCQIEDILQKYKFATRPAWWVYKAYADSSEDTRIQASPAGGSNLIVLASYSQDKSVLRILVGYYTEADQSFRAKNTSLEINNLASPQAKVKVQKIPGNKDVLEKPIDVSEENISVNNSTLSIDLGKIAKDEVFIVALNILQ